MTNQEMLIFKILEASKHIESKGSQGCGTWMVIDTGLQGVVRPSKREKIEQILKEI